MDDFAYQSEISGGNDPVVENYEVPDEFKNLTRVYGQQKENNRPRPFISSFSMTGVMTIAWDRPMQPYEKPKQIPLQQIAVSSRLVELK